MFSGGKNGGNKLRRFLGLCERFLSPQILLAGSG
jgi:hypothetical protein